jgi:gliding motility-associated-like protein
MSLRRIIFTLLGILFYSYSSAQLTVGTGLSAQQLVQNVLLGGGVTVSNVTYTGSGSSRGNFTGGAGTNLGISNGIVLATRNVNSAPLLGSAVSNFAGEDMGQPGDPDLALLLSGSVNSYDASVLQFDFIPLSDTIKFRYVFASEEYPEYVCSTFNDVFGFFVSGPGISGPYSNSSINIALIPNSALPVAINTVNQGNMDLNFPSSDCQSLVYSSYFVYNEAQGGTTIVFDGFTTVLTAWCVVQPCQQYHIKLAVCDIGDADFDSAVFLEAGSFSSTTVTIKATTTNASVANDSTAVEGCSDNIITFTRTGSSNASVMTVPITVAGTATNGVDYTNLPTTVTFPAGSATTTITVDAIADGIPDNNETVIISVPQVTACSSFEPKVTIHISDPSPMTLSVMNDTSIICPVTFNILANASGGNGNIAYLWGNGLGTNASIQVTPFTTTTYNVTASDGCGQQLTEDVTISMPQYNPVQITMSPDPTICSGQSASISASASGGIGYYSFSWSAGLGSNDTVSVSPPQTTTYTVSVSDSCGIITTGTVTVNILPVDADFTYAYIANEILGFQDASVNGADFLWEFGDGEQSTDQNPTHTFPDTGLYVVTLIVTNSVGCIDSIQKEVMVYPPFHLYVPNCFTPDDNGLNDYFEPIAVGVTKSEMQIFDRWGCTMFHSEENNSRWNGRDSKNERVQIGVYVYLLNYMTPTGIAHSSIGTVTLLR